MARYIDADKLIEELSAGCMPICEKGISGVLGDESCIKDYIDNAPTADVRPERHGHWSSEKIGYKGIRFRRCFGCGHCGVDDEYANYCARCGAKMDS
ncbi:MAG: hypothetical protein K2N56_05160 [Oscillospiraceae bacterium]|nr:hypothetical protein [Oscillospiraceae bacterium]